MDGASAMDRTWVVYILQCNDGTFYTGITDDLRRRIDAHTAGKGAKYTKGRGPFVLRYCKRMPSRSHALKEEYRIKQLPRKEKALICEEFSAHEVV